MRAELRQIERVVNHAHIAARRVGAAVVRIRTRHALDECVVAGDEGVLQVVGDDDARDVVDIEGVVRAPQLHLQVVLDGPGVAALLQQTDPCSVEQSVGEKHAVGIGSPGECVGFMARIQIGGGVQAGIAARIGEATACAGDIDQCDRAELVARRALGRGSLPRYPHHQGLVVGRHDQTAVSQRERRVDVDGAHHLVVGRRQRVDVDHIDASLGLLIRRQFLQCPGQRVELIALPLV